MNIKNKILIAFSITFISICISSNTFAINILDINKEEFTESYTNWEKLSDEEKNKTIQPLPFSSNSEQQNYYFNPLNSNLKASSSIPARYFMGNDIELIVRDQKNTSECWAFTTTNLISTNLEKTKLKNNFVLFSPRHMDYTTSRTFSDGINSKGYNRDIVTGGNCYLGLSYCTAGYGPVLESSMPFENNTNSLPLSSINNKKVEAQVNEYIELPSVYKKIVNGKIVYYNGYSSNQTNYKEYSETEINQIRNRIKQQIMNYGAVSSVTYASGTSYFNTNNISTARAYYCNSTDKIANHAITIVGWDDNYAVTNFNANNMPLNKGAYIVLNSHGSNYYNNGYVYISYDDFLVESSMFAVTKTSEVDYSKIYQYDELGYSLSCKVNSSSAYIANVFNKTGNTTSQNEYLTEVGFYVPLKQKIEIYANVENNNKNSLTKIASCGELEIGYHTVQLSSPIKITGNNFVISVKYTNSNGKANLPMEFNYKSNSAGTNYWDTATSKSGQSFVSLEGSEWSDLLTDEEIKDSNFCIKAFTKIEDNKNVGVMYKTHVRDIGWQNWTLNGKTAGTTGQNKRVEAIYIQLVNAPSNGKILYQAHVQDIGWQSWKTNGNLAGTTGKGKQVEAIKIKLENMNNYVIQYRAHVQDIGWQDWKCDGELAGTTGQNKQIEAIQIRILEKINMVTYQTYVQGSGWQVWKSDGEIAGTTGQNKRTEAYKIKLTNDSTSSKILYQTHVSDIGWQGWVSNGAIAGVTNQGRRVEAIKIKLQNLNDYIVQYKAHVQDIGWQDWKSDGAIAGTTGKGKKIEALQVRILKDNNK